MEAEPRLAQSLREELSSCELLGMSLVRAILPQVIQIINMVHRFMIWLYDYPADLGEGCS